MKNVFVGFFFFFVVQGACADAVNDVLWDKLSRIHTMKAEFTQHIYAKKRELSRSSGTMAFVRPGHFRWETKQPMEQLLIADGKKIWLYDVDLEQVTVKQQTESMGSAAGLFLSDDKSGLVRDFHVTSEHQDEAEIFQLKAKAKQANIQRVTLRFEGEQLESMDLYDQLGQHTAVHFQKIKMNMTLPEKRFHFSPPAGVDVVEQ